MNLITPSYQKYFEQIRQRSTTNKETFLTLFARPVGDQWPLQHRIWEYDFLSDLSPKDRDKEILRYAVQCWIDVQDCARQLNYAKTYVCCIVFHEEDSKDLALLWPELFFFNARLEPLLQPELCAADCEFGRYITAVLAELNLPIKPVVLEGIDKGTLNMKIYVDFEPQQNEPRCSLMSLRRKKSEPNR